MNHLFAGCYGCARARVRRFLLGYFVVFASSAALGNASLQDKPDAKAGMRRLQPRSEILATVENHWEWNDGATLSKF